MVAAPTGFLAAILLVACADPSGPSQVVRDPTTFARLGPRWPTGPMAPPDSVGIPPSIPPIYDEIPLELSGAR
jgi:hypothetical protein